MKIIECTQGDPAWVNARLGIPTASEFDALITPKFEMRTGQMPTTYLYDKLAEKVLGFSTQDASSFQMQQGSILEHEAIPWLAFAHDVKINRVGFCTTDDSRIGCSPDGLIGDDGGVEVKCPSPAIHMKYLMEGGVPPQYLCQVHGSLLVTGRKWWKFVSYSRQFPALVVHVDRDDRIIGAMQHTLDHFLKRFDEALAQITAMRAAENAVKNAAYEKSVAEGRA